MRRQRYRPKSYAHQPTIAFDNTEEAWFWFVRCQQVRRDGAKLDSDLESTPRPCDPDDVYCAVARLFRSGIIRSAHLRVLAHYGRLQRSPDPRCPEQSKAAQYWDEAIDRLSSPLHLKGIVQ